MYSTVSRVSTKTGTLFPTAIDDSTVPLTSRMLDKDGRGEEHNVQYAPASQDQHLPAAYMPLQSAAHWQVYEIR